MNATRRPTVSRVRGRRAFTLTEVIMASFVLALALTTSLTTLQRGFADLDTARNIEIASRIIQCEIEKERMLTWAQVSDSAYAPSIDSAFQSNPRVAGRFTLTRAVATVANHGGNMLQITLTVSWRSYDGHTQRRMQTTYYGNGGLYTYLTTQA